MAGFRYRRPVTGRRWQAAGALAAVLAVLCEAWFPFRFDVPWTVRHGPARTEAGVAHFDGRSALVGEPSPRWLTRVLAGGDEAGLRIVVEARSDTARQDGPARVLALSADVLSSDVMVGQEDARLHVRVRRPGSDRLGEPALGTGVTFADGAWHTVTLSVGPGAVQLDVDGQPVEVVDTGEPALAGWDGAHRPALGDEAGGARGWKGSIRRAQVEIDHGGRTEVVDLLAPGELDAASGRAWDSRLDHFGALVPLDPPPVSALRFAGFALVALAIRRGLPGRHRWAVLAALTLPLVATLGKLFVARRDPVLADAAIGAVAAVVVFGSASKLSSGEA